MAKTKLNSVSGFPEFLPAEQILFNGMLEVVRKGFERFGFSPIETPAVERKDILMAKGGNEKEIYALSRLAAEPGESPETDLALHFDLTVPLARYVALYKNHLTFPFRRYQIQKVWRGERAQAGRYREFYQCDIDVIGRKTLSLLADAEIPSIIYHIFHEMAIGRFLIKINNRKILQGYFQDLGISPAQMTEVLRIIDKLERTGKGRVTHELIDFGLDEDKIRKALTLLCEQLSTNEMLAKLKDLPVKNNLFAQGVTELAQVVEGVRTLGVPEDYFAVDLSIARGLDYYTGTIYETILVEQPTIGSICSGGRYDDLTAFFTNEALPGVGISIGLTRLVTQLLAADIVKAETATVATVLITSMDEERISDYLRLSSLLRQANIPTELYSEKARLSEQLRYANKKGFKLVVIAGAEEFSQASVQVKNMTNGQQVICAITDLVGTVHNQLNSLSS